MENLLPEFEGKTYTQEEMEIEVERKVTLINGLLDQKVNQVNDIVDKATGKNGKPWWTSKTMVVNLIMVAVVVVNQVFGLGIEVDTETALGVAGMINIILRMVTTSGVTIK